MKLRQKPDDFLVEELPCRTWQSKGFYSIYKISKVNMTTFAAEKVLATHCNVSFKQIGFAGLKDAHARTVQYFSVESKNPELGNFKEQNVLSEHVGFSDLPLRTGDLKGNRFKIVVRNLSEHEVLTAQKNFEHVKKGVPNYFDSQRFGSLRGVDGFIAKDVLKGDYESAVKKIITPITRHQKPKIKFVRKFIRSNWGKWDSCYDEIVKSGLERTVEGTVIRCIIETGDFKIAFQSTFRGIREIFFSAFQSFIWNECVRQLVRLNSRQVFSVQYEAGRLTFSKDNILNGTFPLVAPDIKTSDDNMALINVVLRQVGVFLTDFNTEEHIFVARERDLFVCPENLELEAGDDDLNRNKKKVTVSFSLPKGSYATIILKALFEK